MKHRNFGWNSICDHMNKRKRNDVIKRLFPQTNTIPIGRTSSTKVKTFWLGQERDVCEKLNTLVWCRSRQLFVSNEGCCSSNDVGNMFGLFLVGSPAFHVSGRGKKEEEGRSDADQEL
mmetsp:Transcript_2217/g.5189  ORF Transcript_2217/g.5189 Transcript_2217/m.5189 type:complete len:118 (-) Transcript_2217:1114-1467(-)